MNPSMLTPAVSKLPRANTTAAILVVGGKAKDLKEGLDLAREVIDGSDALLKLEALVELSQALAEDQN